MPATEQRHPERVCPTRDGRGRGRAGLGEGAGPSCRALCSRPLHTVQCHSCCSVGSLLWAPACSAAPQRDMRGPAPAVAATTARAEGGHAQPAVTCCLRNELPARAAAALPCRRCWEQLGHSLGSGCAAAVTPLAAAPAAEPSLELNWASSGANQDLAWGSHRDVGSPGPPAAPCTRMDTLVAGTAQLRARELLVCAEGPAACAGL